MSTEIKLLGGARALVRAWRAQAAEKRRAALSSSRARRHDLEIQHSVLVRCADDLEKFVERAPQRDPTESLREHNDNLEAKLRKEEGEDRWRRSR